MAEGSARPDGRSGPEYGAWLRRAYLDDGMTAGEIGALLGLGEHEVQRDLRAFGIRKRAAYRPWTDGEFVREVLDLFGSGMDVIGIAASLECSRNSVRQVLLSSGAKMRTIPQATDPVFLAWLQNAYIREGKPAGEIADELGCGDVTVLNRLHDAGITVRGPARKLPPEDDGEFREWLREEYLEKGMSSPDIAARLGCSGALVRARLAKYGFTARGRHMTGNSRMALPGSTSGAKVLDSRMAMAGILGFMPPNDVQVYHFDGDASNNGPDNLFAVGRAAGMVLRNADRWLARWTEVLRGKHGDASPAEPAGRYGVPAGEAGRAVMADVLEHAVPDGCVVGYVDNWPGGDREENLFVATPAGYARYAEHCRERDAAWLGQVAAGWDEPPGRAMGPPFDDWLRRMYVGRGLTKTGLGEVMGCSEPSVHHRLARLGLCGHRGPEGALSRRPGLEDGLRRMYVEERRSLAAIGKALGCSGSHVQYLLEKHGIGRNRPVPMIRQPGVREEMERLCAEGAGAAGIAVRLGCSESHVRRMMRGFGISGPDRGG